MKLKSAVRLHFALFDMYDALTSFTILYRYFNVRVKSFHMFLISYKQRTNDYLQMPDICIGVEGDKLMVQMRTTMKTTYYRRISVLIHIRVVTDPSLGGKHRTYTRNFHCLISLATGSTSIQALSPTWMEIWTYPIQRLGKFSIWKENCLADKVTHGSIMAI